MLRITHRLIDDRARREQDKMERAIEESQSRLCPEFGVNGCPSRRTVVHIYECFYQRCVGFLIRHPVTFEHDTGVLELDAAMRHWVKERETKGEEDRKAGERYKQIIFGMVLRRRNGQKKKVFLQVVDKESGPAVIPIVQRKIGPLHRRPRRVPLPPD